jgi:hypothetical protein
MAVLIFLFNIQKIEYSIHKLFFDRLEGATMYKCGFCENGYTSHIFTRYSADYRLTTEPCCKECLRICDCYCEKHDTPYIIRVVNGEESPNRSCALCAFDIIETLDTAIVIWLTNFLKANRDHLVDRTLAPFLSKKALSAESKKYILHQLLIKAQLNGHTLIEEVTHQLKGRLDATLH